MPRLPGSRSHFFRKLEKRRYGPVGLALLQAYDVDLGDIIDVPDAELAHRMLREKPLIEDHRDADVQGAYRLALGQTWAIVVGSLVAIE